MPATDEIIDTYELAERLSLSAEKVRELVKDGRIPCFRFGPKTIRFSWQEVVESLKNRREDQPGTPGGLPEAPPEEGGG